MTTLWKSFPDSISSQHFFLNSSTLSHSASLSLDPRSLRNWVKWPLQR